jgi:predicted glutamine amidotransferase
MPINDQNAHPFPYWRIFFAHNGKVVNWREIQDLLVTHFAARLKEASEAQNANLIKVHDYCLRYCQNITTDSQVLGPYIESRDFAPIIGCMGLVWLVKNNVYAMRYAKEAVAATIIWRSTAADDEQKDHLLTIVASTPSIICAIERVPNIQFDVGQIQDLAEGYIYRVEPTGLVSEGKVNTNEPVADEFSSEAIPAEAVPAETTPIPIVVEP